MRLTLLSKVFLFTATALTLFAQSSQATSKASTSSSVKLLTKSEVLNMSNADRLTYFKALQNIFIAIEESGGPGAYDDFTFFSLIFPPTYAAMRAGQACWIGGYESTWYKRKGGGLSCQEPSKKDIYDDPDKGQFRCGKNSKGQPMAYCKSTIFLYANDGGERQCQPLKNLSANCARAFNDRYANKPDLLAADTKKLLESLDPNHTGADEYYSYLEERLNKYLKENKRDAKTADILLTQIKTMNDIRAKTPKQEVATTPPPSSSKLLGDELSCVRDGLKSLGYQPSDRFIALVGTGIQSANGGFDTAQGPAQSNLRSRVISAIQSYGFCDEASYPSDQVKPNEAALIRRWITADAGRAKAQPSGIAYLQQISDPKTPAAAARDFHAAFGLRAVSSTEITLDHSVDMAIDGLFVSPMKKTDQTSLDRQSAMAAFENFAPNTDFAKCYQSAKDLRDADPAFSLELARPMPVGKDGKRPVLSAEQRTTALKVIMGSTKVCEAMAKSCGIDFDTQCGHGKPPMDAPAKNGDKVLKTSR